MTSINFCGDSFLRYDTPESWCTILAKKLNAKIMGFGKSGSAFEHAIESFNPSADITIFSWTDPNRLYHPRYIINYARAEAYKDSNLVLKAAYLYYKLIHDFPSAKDSQIRQLYWFDKTVLSKYKGKCIHLWGFEETYKFENGKTFLPPLIDLAASEKDQVANHMTVAQNAQFAETMYDLCQKL